jgi:hypothetical protein
MTHVEVGYFPDKRLKLLLRCWIGDRNFWYDPTTKSYTLCLEEDIILLAFEAYLALNGYNIWKLRERRYHTD